MTHTTLPRFLTLVAAMIVGAIALRVFDSGLAYAEPVEADAPATPDPRLLCKAFAIKPDQAVDTSDRNEPVGQWIAAQSDWVLFSVDLDVAQKPSTYPQHWLHVCLAPR